MPFEMRHRPVHRGPVRPPNADAIAVHGMHGLGDNIHQRAIIRQLMQRKPVYLETPWPSIYHDLVGDCLKLVPKATVLRTQAKNAAREASRYTAPVMPWTPMQVRVWYTGEDVRRYGSIFAAMVRNAGCDMATADFRLPVLEVWQAQRYAITGPLPAKPIMVYRPLVERTEWQGCRGRNPNIEAYYQILSSIRDHFFIVSIADLVPDTEWISGISIDADLELHRGELTFEAMAALFEMADLVFASPGFAPLLAQAVGTPSITVFGGHESSMTIKDGARFAPTLGIDPIEPCNCFNHQHAHKKAIDVPRAVAHVRTFVEEQCELR